MRQETFSDRLTLTKSVSRSSFWSPLLSAFVLFADLCGVRCVTELDSYCDCELPGFFHSGVSGIIAHMEHGRLAPEAVVERCDLCLRFPSDAAALQFLSALGLA